MSAALARFYCNNIKYNLCEKLQRTTACINYIKIRHHCFVYIYHLHVYVCTFLTTKNACNTFLIRPEIQIHVAMEGDVGSMFQRIIVLTLTHFMYEVYRVPQLNVLTENVCFDFVMFERITRIHDVIAGKVYVASVKSCIYPPLQHSSES